MRAQLQQNIKTLKAHLTCNKWQLMPSETSVQPLMVGGNHDVLRLSEYLQERGVLVPAIRPPTVPKNTARLRISLSAAHSEADVIKLAQTINEAERELA